MRFYILILAYLAFSRCNPHLIEHLDPSLLPEHLLPFFGDAMLNELRKSDFMMFIMIPMAKFTFLRFLGGRRRDRIQISRYKMRQFLTRRCDQKLSLPLSNLHFHLDYEAKIREAISQANRSSLFLTAEGNHYVSGNTCEPMFQLRDRIILHIFHPNGKFDAMLTVSGEIFMGRIGDPLELKVKVINSPFKDKRKAVVCVFDPKSEMLVVGLMNGDFEFYRFTDRSHSATPLFEMKMTNSYIQTGGESRIVSITASPCGKYFVILHDFSCGILVTKNGDNSFVFRQFLSDRDFMHIGTISALAFFGSSMILTVQSKKYCVWKIDIDGTITKVSEIEPIKVDGRDPVRVKQIIVKDDADADAASFIFRIKESILVLRLEDCFKTCRVLITHPIYYEQFAGGFDSEFTGLTIFLKRNLLILVVPCQKTILLFKVKDTEITILAKKNIKGPTYWSYNPHTSVLTLDYDYGSSGSGMRCLQPSVQIGV